MKRTKWIDGDVNPAHVGVYERRFMRPRYSYWDGKMWHYSALNPVRAMHLTGIVAPLQNLPWRGLAKKP